MYSKEVLKHFRNPKNVGRIKDADGIGKVGNPMCGDVMYVYIKVEKNKKGEEFIKDIKAETMGCVAAIATTSMITEIVKGKTLKDAEKISSKDIAKALKGLPKIKYHCSVMGIEGLKKAIEDYKKKSK